ncbi:hypothetical protein HDU96_008776 [Phlyctochytrium bullatum]|nr:hypothetical protein HDU96_008776 [Phlyctochytrium bullatum]
MVTQQSRKGLGLLGSKGKTTEHPHTLGCEAVADIDDDSCQLLQDGDDARERLDRNETGRFDDGLPDSVHCSRIRLGSGKLVRSTSVATAHIANLFDAWHWLPVLNAPCYDEFNLRWGFLELRIAKLIELIAVVQEKRSRTAILEVEQIVSGVLGSPTDPALRRRTLQALPVDSVALPSAPRSEPSIVKGLAEKQMQEVHSPRSEPSIVKGLAEKQMQEVHSPRSEPSIVKGLAEKQITNAGGSSSADRYLRNSYGGDGRVENCTGELKKRLAEVLEVDVEGLI